MYLNNASKEIEIEVTIKGKEYYIAIDASCRLHHERMGDGQYTEVFTSIEYESHNVLNVFNHVGDKVTDAVERKLATNALRTDAILNEFEMEDFEY